jgi:general stress protein YciG
MPNNDPAKKPQGFAALSIERRREIASQGGRAAHALGTAHRFTSEQARSAGQRGGLAKKHKN